MLSWLNPLMLFGALAAAVPVLLHMMLRRRTRLVKFSRVFLLQQVQRFSERHFRLKQLLLLALRVLAILLLAAAFARPWWRSEEPKTAGPSRAVLALLDVSASMRCGDRFDDAVGKLTDRLGDLSSADQAGLMTFARAPRVVAPMTPDIRSVVAAVKAQSATYEATDIAEALQAGADLLSEAPQDVHTLLLVSDLQQNALAGLNSDWHLPDGMEIEIIHVGNQPPLNGAVTDVQIASSESAAAARSVRALVSHYADADQREFEVTLLAGGRRLDSRRFVIPAGDRRIVAFSLPEDLTAAEAAVRINADSFDLDDMRYFVIPPEERYHVVLLADPEDAEDGESLFPAAALEAGANSPYQVERVAPADAVARDPWSASFVIVPGETSVNEPTAAWLASCAEAGGVVLIGAAASPDGPDARAALADAAPIGWIQADPNATIFQMLADLDMRNAVFSPFRGLQRGNFTAMDFYGHLRVAPGPTAVVVATFDDGTPALVERRMGRGRILLWTTSFGPETGNFPLRGLYVAFIRNIAHTAFARRQAQRGYLVGDTALLQGRPGESVTVRRPDGRAVPLAFSDEGVALFTETDLPGVYRVADDPVASFSVNLDPKESVLESAWEEDVLAQVRVQEETGVPQKSVAEIEEQNAQSAKIWRALMAALLIIAVAELWLANHTPR
jgi:hypothetical protein